MSGCRKRKDRLKRMGKYVKEEEKGKRHFAPCLFLVWFLPVSQEEVSRKFLSQKI